jgi:hypothetical protein
MECDQLWLFQSGHPYKELIAFQQMIDIGKKPNRISSAGFLSVCSRVGYLMNEGTTLYNVLWDFTLIE